MGPRSRDAVRPEDPDARQRTVRLTIVRKSILTISLLIAFSLAVVGVYLERRERAAIIGQSLARLEAQAALLAPEVAGTPRSGDAWAQRMRVRLKARVTLIAPDGRVLADSSQASGMMENHADRPEVVAALARGSGYALRYSQTIGRELLYYAQAVPRPGGGRLVLRLAIPLTEISGKFSQFRRDFLLIALLSLGLASGIALLWVRGIALQLRRMVGFARNVARGEGVSRLPRTSRDEIGDLAEALNEMAADLQDTLHQLEEESRRARTIMESMGEGLLVLDAHGKISLVNPAAEALLGMRRDRALGHIALEAVRSHELDDLLKAAGQQEGSARAEITLVYPRRRILAGTAVAIRDAGRAFQGTVVALRDITELKRLEEVRMEFVLNVSHELRTPLTAIRGYAETLLDSGLRDQDETRKFLEVILRHAERLGRLLNELLDLSNIELDRAPLHIRPVPLSDVARQAKASLAPQAEQKRIHLLSDLPESLPAILADRDRLMQVLVNLLDNSVKYTSEGGQVALRARPTKLETAPAGTTRPAIEILVEDTGIGIPLKDLPRVTERFYRVDKGRSRELGGTGLGLAIVKHVVQVHEGALRIESELGRGTRVYVTLPAATTEVAPPS
jgi:two-component system phosphate regulon sensor histidine kinase PhoR